MVEKESFDHLLGLLVRRISKAMPADGVLLNLHGSMVTEEFEDVEAEIVRSVRAAVSPGVPIIVTLNLHANISPTLVEHATNIIEFDTYPHVDMAECGREAALLIERTVRGGVSPVQVFRNLPF